MRYKKFGNSIVIRLDMDEEIVSSVLQVAKQEHISYATVEGSGVIYDFTLNHLNLKKDDTDEYTYPNVHNIVTLNGVVKAQQRSISAYLQMIAEDNKKCYVSGHLIRGVVAATAEIVLESSTPLCDQPNVDDSKCRPKNQAASTQNMIIFN